VGILTRMERYFVLIPLLIFNQPFMAVALIALLGNITAFQRIAYVREQGHERMRKARETKEYLQ